MAREAKFQKSLERAGWDNLLEPVRIKKDPTGNEGRAIISRMQELVAKRRQDDEQKLLEMLAGVEQLEIDRAYRGELRKALLRGRSGEATNRRNVLELQSIAQVLTLYEWLHNDAKWDIRDGYFEFYNTRDTDRFNGAMRVLKRLSGESSELDRAITKSLTTGEPIVVPRESSPSPPTESGTAESK